MTESLFVGYERKSGNEVEVPVFHTLVTGQTQLSGKTTCLKTFAQQLAELGYKIFLVDTKENKEDYENFGKEIPVCLRESTDPLVLLPLLESVFQRRLPTGYYSVLCDITGGTKTYDEVIKKAKDKEKSSRSGWVQGTCRTLYDLLERLQTQLSKVETVPQLELPYQINRMVLNDFPQASQQLFIRNAFEDLLRIHSKHSIGMLDEAYKFLPQKWGSACAKAIQDAITQTAGTDTYIYLGTQFLAPTNKDPLKACAVRLLGTQDHTTEAKHTLDLIPFKGICTVNEIMTLPLGHYIVTTKKFAKLIYFLPYGVPKRIGKDVSLGKKTSEYVRDQFLVSRLQEEDEEMYREKYEEEKSRREKAEKKLKELTHKFAKERVAELRAETERLRGDLKSADTLKAQKDEEISKLRKELEGFRELKSALTKILPTPPQPAGRQGPEIPSEITVDMEQPALTVNVPRKPLTLNQSNLEGRIAIVYAEGLPTDKWFTVTDVNRAMMSHGWPRDPRTSKMLDQFCQWGFFKKRYAGKRPEYRVRMTPEKAKEKGLLKIHEIEN